MASFFAVEGTVTSISDLRRGKTGRNYIRLELKINTNEKKGVIYEYYFFGCCKDSYWIKFFG